MRRTTIIGVAVLLVLGAGPLSAQPSGDMLVARKHYELGEQLYKTSDYSGALTAFTKAYRLSNKPALLFNLARCHEVMADLDLAVKFYRQYLAQVPGAPNRPLVESRLRNLEARLARRKADAAAAAPAPSSSPATQPASPAVPASQPAPTAASEAAASPTADQPPAAIDPPPGDWKRPAGWVSVGVGGAALIAGVIVGSMAAAKATDYEEAANTTLYDDLAGMRDEGQALQSAQIALLVVGGILAAAGGGLLLWDHLGRAERTPAQPAVLAPVLTRDYVGFSGRIQF